MGSYGVHYFLFYMLFSLFLWLSGELQEGRGMYDAYQDSLDEHILTSESYHDLSDSHQPPILFDEHEVGSTVDVGAEYSAVKRIKL